MGTRGTIRIRYNGKVICFYNHWDSYPSGLGVNFLTSIKKLIEKYGMEGFISKIKSLKIVTDLDKPTEEDKIALAPYTDLTVSSCSNDDWYCLMRKMQGNLESIIESGYAYHQDMDDEDFNYVLNIDTLTVGFDDQSTETQTPINKIDDLLEEWIEDF